MNIYMYRTEYRGTRTQSHQSSPQPSLSQPSALAPDLDAGAALFTLAFGFGDLRDEDVLFVGAAAASSPQLEPQWSSPAFDLDLEDERVAVWSRVEEVVLLAVPPPELLPKPAYLPPWLGGRSAGRASFLACRLAKKDPLLAALSSRSCLE